MPGQPGALPRAVSRPPSRSLPDALLGGARAAVGQPGSGSSAEARRGSAPPASASAPEATRVQLDDTAAAACAALVRDWGGAEAGTPDTAAGWDAEAQIRPLEAIASAAVSLAFLTDFHERCVAPLPGGAALSTGQVVSALVVPCTRAAGCVAFTSLVPRAVGKPHAFASHAFGNPFALLVAALRARFADAVAAEVYVWVDIFAINQHAPGSDLHGGKALARTIEIAAETLVVLDPDALPLSRLWCLYEIGSTPPAKLQLLTPGVCEADIAAAARKVDVSAAQCFDARDTAAIREHIVVAHSSLDAFSRLLRLRLLLKPTSYEADRAALLGPAGAAAEAWRFDGLAAFVSGNTALTAQQPAEQPSRGSPCGCHDADDDAGADRAVIMPSCDAASAPLLACVVSGPGVGKSTLAAALCAARAPAKHGHDAAQAPPLLTAHHFFKASDVRRQDLGELVRSLAYQLACAHAAFGDALLALPAAAAESALSDPARGAELLLLQPLRCLANVSDPPPRVTLLFDALDEAEAAEAPGSISRALRLILGLGLESGSGGALPPISVVVTTRPEPRILDALRGCWRDAMTVFPAEAQRQDAAPPPHAGAGGMLLARALSAARSRARSREPRLLAYLRTAMRAEGLAAEAVSTVDAAYELFFAAAGPLAPPVRRALALLLAARQPPSLALLEGLHAREACAALPGWHVLFRVRNHAVHALHKSLVDWLTDPARSHGHAADVAAGHAAWAEHLSAQLRPWLDAGDEAAAPPRGSYCYAHALAHLDAAGRHAEARALLLRLPWLQAALRERGAHALMADVAEHAAGCPPLRLLYRCLVFCVGALLRPDAAEELPGALVGRLMRVPGDDGWRDVEPRSAAAAGVAGLYAAAFAWRGPRAWLRVVGLTQRNPVGPLQMRLDGHAAPITCVAALPDGATVVSGDAAGGARVWSVPRSECVLQLHARARKDAQGAAPLRCVAALPGGRAATGGDAPRITVWNVVTGEEEAVHAVPCATAALLALALLPASRAVLLAGGADGVIRAVDCSSRRRGRGWRSLALRGHAGPVCGLAQLPLPCAPHRRGRLAVASASADATLRLWELPGGKPMLVLRAPGGAPARCLVALPGGRLASGHDDACIRLWAPPAGCCACGAGSGGGDDAALDATLRGHAAAVTCIGALRGGGIISGSDDGTLLAWERRADEKAAAASGNAWHWRLVTGPEGQDAPAPPPPPGARPPGDRDFSATCVAVLATAGADVEEQCHVASGHRDGSLRTFDPHTAEVDVPAPLSKHVKLVTCLAPLPPNPATPGELRVASGSRDGAVRLWDASRGRCVRMLTGHAPGKDITLLAALACSRRLVSASQDDTVRLWALDGDEHHDDACLQVAPAGSGAARELLGLPRAPPPPPLPPLAAAFAAGVRGDGIFLLAPGCTRTMLGNGNAQPLCLARPGGGVRVVVCADRWVHFFSVVPAAGAAVGPDGRSAPDDGPPRALC